jgi:hypothetical protein
MSTVVLSNIFRPREFTGVAGGDRLFVHARWMRALFISVTRVTRRPARANRIRWPLPQVESGPRSATWLSAMSVWAILSAGRRASGARLTFGQALGVYQTLIVRNPGECRPSYSQSCHI